MATTVTGMEAILVSNLTFYRPSRDGRRKPVSIHTIPHTVLPPITLEGGYTRSIPHDLGDSALSTRPRPSLDLPSVSREERPTWHRTCGLFTVLSPMSHGVRGWPAIPRARRYSHLYRDRQNFTSRLPRHPGLLLPYKSAGQGSTRGGRQSKTQARSQAQIGKGTQPTDQHLKQSPLYSHFSFET
jgi:hypothetical protein